MKLRDAISGIVKRRFDDMNAFYKDVWFRNNRRPFALRVRRFPLSLPPGCATSPRQAGIVDTELKKTLTASSSESDVEKAILKVMETRSMPGFSRHHWGTDMDLVSAERTDWDPSTGRFAHLIPFLQEHAFRFGFFHPYTAGYSRSGGRPHNPDSRAHRSPLPRRALACVLLAHRQRAPAAMAEDIHRPVAQQPDL